MVDRRGAGDQRVGVLPDGLLAAVPEELLRRRIPRGHPVIRIDRDDRGRADLQQRLEVPLLPLQLADVVIDDQIPGRLSLLDHRHDDQLDVRKRSVPAGSLSNRMESSSSENLFVAHGRAAQIFSRRDQIVQLAPDCLIPRVAEQVLRSQVPRRDAAVPVNRDDRCRIDLHQ